ncbi:MAG: hypothetical protein JJ966_08750 [Balneolaceae bacterium]|nr:hypothetical protein [Balneolaceae bacterium]
MNEGFKDSLNELVTFLIENDFLLISENSSRIHLKKNELDIYLSFNELEKKHELFICWREQVPVTISNTLMKKYFTRDLEINSRDRDSFQKNMISFFRVEGNGIVEGDNSLLANLTKYQLDVNDNLTKYYV